jgi:ATP-binding cassette subfamily B (MDR/TAP) protein 1
MDRQPLITNPINGKRPETFNGVIKFEGVSFAYPKDKSKKILDNISLEFDANNSALVGESGCGKSTIFQLIMRFYDPDEGRITIDGNDLKELDLIWLKEKIGYVGQEPVLFATTIR